MNIEIADPADLGDLRVVRAAELCKLLDVTPPTLYRWQERGDLPPRRRFGPNCVG